VKKLRLSYIFLALILAFASLAPATAYAASDGQNATTAASPNSILSIKNKSIGAVTVTLTGPKAYTIYAPVGVKTQEIVKGVYKYSYTACGLNVTGTLKANGAKSNLPIAACKTVNLVIVNASYTTMTLSMSGPANYYWTIPARSVVRAKILRGTYRWTMGCSGRTASGTFAATKGRAVAYCR
jgi:hypothetical protein